MPVLTRFTVVTMIAASSSTTLRGGWTHKILDFDGALAPWQGFSKVAQ